MKVLRSFAVLFLLIGTAQAQKTEFMRIVKDDSGEITSLETSIVSYTMKQKDSPDPIQVDLVSVIHIGDKAYYRNLNKEFESYEVVLYELVAPPGARPPKKKDGAASFSPKNPLAMLQTMMKNALALEHQLEIVDYDKLNFVHADLSFGALMKAAQDRGEDELTFGIGIARDVMMSMNKAKRVGPGEVPNIPEIDIISLFLGDRGEGRKLKRAFAKMIDPKKMQIGKTLENSIVGDRNEACIKELKKQIGGKMTKIAIFYGAAHMPDFERRLVIDQGMKKGETKWLKAWNLEE